MKTNKGSFSDLIVNDEIHHTPKLGNHSGNASFVCPADHNPFKEVLVTEKVVCPRKLSSMVPDFGENLQKRVSFQNFDDMPKDHCVFR